ncbi:GNAT family N-acetyltransferase [candidate division WOR-3 bacterium]|nr:GNAT family N-acetyltransferase [candidate division WOR-3 bacterium]
MMKVDIFSIISKEFSGEGIFSPGLIQKAAELTGAKTSFYKAQTDKVKIYFYTFFKRGKMLPVPAFSYSCISKIEKRNEGKSFERHMLSLAKEISGVIPRRSVILVSPEIPDVRPFIWNGFKAETLYTYIAEPGWQADYIEREELKQIRKAEGADQRIEEDCDIDLLSNMVFNSYSRHGKKPPYDRTYLTEMMRKALELKIMGLKIACSSNGTPSAFRASLRGRTTGYDWLAGSTETGLSLGMNSLLLKRLIMEETASGRIFDLCGANTESVSFFKAGFGLKLLRYSKLTR